MTLTHRLAQTILLASALSCGSQAAHEESTSNGVTRAELAIYLDWFAELREATRTAQAEATALVAETTDLDSRLAVLERNKARIAPIVAREPLQGTRKREAIRAVLQAFYATGAFVRDEAELERLRASYGNEMIDSIADEEALFREKLP